MRQWDIYRAAEIEGARHPVVVISNDERCSNVHYDMVNVLLCSSAPVSGNVRRTEIKLDAADGLDWTTACQCEYFYTFEKSWIESGERIGTVSHFRKVAICAKIRESLRFLTQ